MMIFAVVAYDEPQPRETVKIDESLFSRIGAGEKDAFCELYEQSSNIVFSYALSVLRNREDAEDAMQETFLKIRSAAHLYVPMGKPMAWIFTIARNICLAKYRQKKRFTGVSVDEVKEPLDFSQISDELNAELTSLLGAGSVLDQSVAATDDLKKLAEQYQITPGKALLLQRLIEENPNLDYAKLAKLPMNELISYLKQSGVDVRNYVHCTGDDLDDDDEHDDDDKDDKDDDDKKAFPNQRPTKNAAKKDVSVSDELDDTDEDEDESDEDESDEDESDEDESGEDESGEDEEDDDD